MKVSVTRIYRFAASHRLHTPALSDAANALVYGKCNYAHGHGHDYVLEVSVSGTPDPESGLVLDIGRLDQYVRERVLRRFDGRNINLDVEEFQRLVPTTENVAAVIAGTLSAGWAESFGARDLALRRIHIQETGRNGFEVLLGAGDAISGAVERRDAVPAVQ